MLRKIITIFAFVSIVFSSATFSATMAYALTLSLMRDTPTVVFSDGNTQVDRLDIVQVQSRRNNNRRAGNRNNNRQIKRQRNNRRATTKPRRQRVNRRRVNKRRVKQRKTSTQRTNKRVNRNIKQKPKPQQRAIVRTNKQPIKTALPTKSRPIPRSGAAVSIKTAPKITQKPIKLPNRAVQRVGTPQPTKPVRPVRNNNPKSNQTKPTLTPNIGEKRLAKPIIKGSPSPSEEKNPTRNQNQNTRNQTGSPTDQNSVRKSADTKPAKGSGQKVDSGKRTPKSKPDGRPTRADILAGVTSPKVWKSIRKGAKRSNVQQAEAEKNAVGISAFGQLNGSTKKDIARALKGWAKNPTADQAAGAKLKLFLKSQVGIKQSNVPNIIDGNLAKIISKNVANAIADLQNLGVSNPAAFKKAVEKLIRRGNSAEFKKEVGDIIVKDIPSLSPAGIKRAEDELTGGKRPPKVGTGRPIIGTGSDVVITRGGKTPDTGDVNNIDGAKGPAPKAGDVVGGAIQPDATTRVGKTPVTQGGGSTPNYGVSGAIVNVDGTEVPTFKQTTRTNDDGTVTTTVTEFDEWGEPTKTTTTTTPSAGSNENTGTPAANESSTDNEGDSNSGGSNCAEGDTNCAPQDDSTETTDTDEKPKDEKEKEADSTPNPLDQGSTGRSIFRETEGRVGAERENAQQRSFNNRNCKTGCAGNGQGGAGRFSGAGSNNGNSSSGDNNGGSNNGDDGEGATENANPSRRGEQVLGTPEGDVTGGPSGNDDKPVRNTDGIVTEQDLRNAKIGNGGQVTQPNPEGTTGPKGPAVDPRTGKPTGPPTSGGPSTTSAPKVEINLNAIKKNIGKLKLKLKGKVNQ